MNPVTRVLKSLAGLLVLLAGMTGAAHAADLSHAVILVASESLADSPYAETVVLVAPLPPGCELATVYTAATATKVESPAEAARFIALLTNAPGRERRQRLGFI